MQEQDQSTQTITSSVILRVITKYKKQLSIMGVVAIILSAIFSSPFFITPLYKSTVILYPTASKSVSKVLLSENPGMSKDILEFGEEEQTEQMLQVLNSNKIRDRLILKYDLLNHYGIPSDADFKMTRLYKEYESNFNYRRTEYMAVKITVLDKDAQMAADMANDIAELVDSTINLMQKEVALKGFQIVEKEYLSLKNDIKVKEDSLTILRQFGVHDYESQSEMFNRQLAIEMADGNDAGVKRLEKKLETLAKYGGPYVSLRDALEHDKKQLSELKAKYDEAKVDATENLPHKFVVDTGYKAEKKSYPIRWLIVVISVFSVLIFGVIIFGAIEVSNGNIDLSVKKKGFKLNALKKPFAQTDSNLENSPRIASDKDENLDKLEQILKEKDKKIDERIAEIEEQEAIIRLEQKRLADEIKNNNLKAVTPASNNKTQRDQKNIEMDNYFNSSNLLNLVNKWKFHLLIVVVVAALLAIIFSGSAFITPMFKSYGIAYPANVDSYSDESETEQMLQVMNSQDIIDSVINKFDLAAHYEIDKNYKYYKSVLFEEYRQNVSISKTPYESVMVEVMDKSPDTAALIVASIYKFYDQKVERLHKTKYKEVIDMYENQLAYKRTNLDSLKQVLFVLGTEYGIFEYQYQSQEIMRGYLKTLTGQGADRVNTKEVKRLLDNIESKGGQLIEVIEMLQAESRAYVLIKQDYEMALRFYNADMTYSNMITSPFAADKKSYPIRWLIVVVVTMAAFVFAMLAILIIEKRSFDIKK